MKIRMSSIFQLFVTSMLAQRVQAHTLKLYQPYGPNMCEALYQNGNGFIAFEFDEVHLICKLSVKTGHDINRFNARTTVTEGIDKSFTGFIMVTKRKLFLIDIPIKKTRISIPFSEAYLSEYLHDYDNGILYKFRLKTGYLFQGVIENVRASFHRYRKFKGSNDIIALVVDERNKMVFLLQSTGQGKAIVNIYNITSQRPRKLAVERCSSRNLILDKENRIIFLAKKKRLFSMDYLGHNKRKFEVEITTSFYLDFQDQHILCVTMYRGSLMKYKINRSSKEFEDKWIPVTCSPRDTPLHYVIKARELIVAVYHTYLGLLVIKGRKCYRVWRRLAVKEIHALD